MKLGFNNKSNLGDVCMYLLNILKLLLVRYHQIRVRTQLPIAVSTPTLTLFKLLLKAKGPFVAGRPVPKPETGFASLGAGAARRRGPAQTGKFPAAETTCAACREEREDPSPPAGTPGPTGTTLDTAAAPVTRQPPDGLGATS